MVLFGAVQYNDPDGLLWMGIYAVPALWCGVGLFWRKVFKNKGIIALYWASVVMAVAGVVYFWPLTPQFWTKDVWYNVETAREGMGLMIVLIVLLVVSFSARKNVTLEDAHP
jgi:hypothetical protein